MKNLYFSIFLLISSTMSFAAKFIAGKFTIDPYCLFIIPSIISGLMGVILLEVKLNLYTKHNFSYLKVFVNFIHFFFTNLTVLLLYYYVHMLGLNFFFENCFIFISSFSFGYAFCVNGDLLIHPIDKFKFPLALMSNQPD